VEDKEPLFQQLNRIEGQVRGLRQMIVDDRHCRDEVQQASAIVAAVREVALLLIAEHLGMGAIVAADSGRKDVVEELKAVLRLALAPPAFKP